MNGSSLGDDNVAGVLDDGHAIGVEQLAVAFAALAELELEAALLVENLIGKYGNGRLRSLVSTDLSRLSLTLAVVHCQFVTRLEKNQALLHRVAT